MVPTTGSEWEPVIYFPQFPAKRCVYSADEKRCRAALNHIGHKVAFAFAVRLPAYTLFNPSDMLRGGAECQKINRKKHASGRHAWPPKPHILDRLNIYSGCRLTCHDVGKWLSLWTGNMLLCVLYLANKAILTLIVSSQIHKVHIWLSPLSVAYGRCKQITVTLAGINRAWRRV